MKNCALPNGAYCDSKCCKIARLHFFIFFICGLLRNMSPVWNRKHVTIMLDPLFAVKGMQGQSLCAT